MNDAEQMDSDALPLDTDTSLVHGTRPNTTTGWMAPTSEAPPGAGSGRSAAGHAVAFGADQAWGLRALFGAAPPRLFLVASALPPAATVALGMGLGSALRARGQHSLLVDEVPLRERGPAASYPVAVRYDLAQVCAGDVGLGRAVRRLAPGLWFAAAGQVAQHAASHRARGLLLTTLAEALEPAIDLVLVVTHRPQATAVERYGQAPRRLLAMGTDTASTALALSHLRAMAGLDGSHAVGVLVVGGPDAMAARAAFDILRAEAAGQLLASVAWLGWAPHVGASSFDEDSVVGGQAGGSGAPGQDHAGANANAARQAGLPPQLARLFDAPTAGSQP